MNADRENDRALGQGHWAGQPKQQPPKQSSDPTPRGRHGRKAPAPKPPEHPAMLGPQRPSALSNWLETKSAPANSIATPVKDDKRTPGPEQVRSGVSDPEAAQRQAAGEHNVKPTPVLTRLARFATNLNPLATMDTYDSLTTQSNVSSTHEIADGLRQAKDAASAEREAQKATGTSALDALFPIASAYHGAKSLERVAGAAFEDKDGDRESGAGTYIDPVDRNIVSPLMTAADVVNDVNSRVATLRKDLVNDPFNDLDNPVYLYTDAAGNEIGTSEDKDQYYKLANGTILSATDADNLEYLDKDDPAAFDAKGNYIGSMGVRGKVQFPIAVMPQTDADWEKAKAYKAFENGTITEYADGTVPKGFREPFRTLLPRDDERYKAAIEKRIARRQKRIDKGEEPDVAMASPLDDKWARAKEILGNPDPRPPWQDKAGNNFWEFGEYQPGQTALRPEESIPWLIDANLSSAPYYVPYYNYASGAAAAAPYLAGYDGAAYSPVNTGFRELDKIGLGTYPSHEITNAQKIGGVVAPMANAWAERGIGDKALGGAIGGMPKFLRNSALGKALEGHMAGRILGGGATEAIEEFFGSLPQMLQQQSFANFAKDEYWNDTTNRMEYDHETPPLKRVTNTLSTIAQDMLAGGALGLGMSAGSEVLNRLSGHGDDAPKGAPVTDLPRARTREELLTDDELRTLRRYQRD